MKKGQTRKERFRDIDYGIRVLRFEDDVRRIAVFLDIPASKTEEFLEKVRGVAERFLTHGNLNHI